MQKNCTLFFVRTDETFFVKWVKLVPDFFHYRNDKPCRMLIIKTPRRETGRARFTGDYRLLFEQVDVCKTEEIGNMVNAPRQCGIFERQRFPETQQLFIRPVAHF